MIKFIITTFISKLFITDYSNCLYQSVLMMIETIGNKNEISERNEVTAKVEPGKSIDLDDILVNEIGEFGWSQIRTLLLVYVTIIITGFGMEYIFSSASIPHR